MSGPADTCSRWPTRWWAASPAASITASRFFKSLPGPLCFGSSLTVCVGGYMGGNSLGTVNSSAADSRELAEEVADEIRRAMALEACTLEDIRSADTSPEVRY